MVGSYPAGTPSRFRPLRRLANLRYRDNRAPAVESGLPVVPCGVGGSRWSAVFVVSVPIMVSSAWKSIGREGDVMHSVSMRKDKNKRRN